MICGGITMEEMSIQSMCACAASVRETSTSETTPSSIKISTTPGSPFRSDLALSICGRVMSPPSSRTLSTYSSFCCTWEECWSAQFTVKPLNFQRQRMFGHRPIITRWRLFHGHTLCEIAWFIDVAAQLNCQVISEKLKRNDRQDWHYVLGRFRQHDYFVGNFFEVLGSVSTSYRNDRSFAGFYLLHVIQVFEENWIVGRDKYGGQIRTN